MITQLGTPSADTTDPSAPEHTLHVTGAGRPVLVINLSSFVDARDADAFRHLRGSEPFADALRKLHPHPPFGLDQATAEAEQDAYKLRIFRSRLLYNHFFPTYHIAWDSTVRERLQQMGCADIGRWQQWSARLRLTRNGLAVISLERPFEDISLINCTEQVLELPMRGERPAVQDQWSIGITLLRAFLDALDRRIFLRVYGNCLIACSTAGFARSSFRGWHDYALHRLLNR